MRKLITFAAAAAALAVPTIAQAYRAGEYCSLSKEATFEAAGYTCSHQDANGRYHLEPYAPLAPTQPPPPKAQPRPQPKPQSLFVLPIHRLTPGAVDHRVTQATIQKTICRPGYTAKVRPPESVTYREKLVSMSQYHDTNSPSHYEFDHLISLELGGAPNNMRNLWPEPGASPNPKDGLENHLHSKVCDGQLSLASARRLIATNWVSAWHQWQNGVL